ncbi:TIGR02594 family protein [Pseudorhodoplanes sinuspersici]|uniref:Uncharacterized protein n=1 Tax=Pseudorhodoplanes sinuspersici TaxID=1235591 RepID=A0A1W6ZR51_9HYPH|nr:TIGR02594 family protein [Pseudorhodoplanes sinuspersici]ARP99755.1 hypothetical protein CAK95_12150 [Pseudorhodoplanes sinuspersici]RKE70746.1 uncharacterized protein (TIGR02594 family) [Pseudorhodoplanes sinuspersici]
MTFLSNKKKSKTFAVTAAIATAVILTAFHSPAEARRYKHKTVRHSAAAVAPVTPFGFNFGVASTSAHRAAPRTAHAPRGRYAHRARHTTRYASRRGQRIVRRVAPAAASSSFAPSAGFGSSNLVAQARRYIGTNPTGMGALWCARFMNMVLERAGHRGTGSNMASSFASYGRRISGPQVGAIAVMSRGKRGGHVGIVSGIDASGNPIIISGNYNRRVAEAKYSRNRIYAYVMP